MSMFKIFNVSGSAVSAQTQRLNVVASNLANADTVAGPDRQAYKARQVVFSTTPMGDVGTAGVSVSQITEDASPGRRVHDPKHPQADAAFRKVDSLIPPERVHRGCPEGPPSVTRPVAPERLLQKPPESPPSASTG